MDGFVVGRSVNESSDWIVGSGSYGVFTQAYSSGPKPDIDPVVDLSWLR